MKFPDGSIPLFQNIYEDGSDGSDHPIESTEILKRGSLYHELLINSYYAPSEILPISPQVGFGLFSTSDLEIGTYVGEYVGTVRKNDRRYTEGLNDYLYVYPLVDEIGRNYVIDATRGSVCRFINHHEDGNLSPLWAYYSGRYHLIFITKKRVSAGEEFFYDYGRRYWELRGAPLTWKKS